MNRPGSDSVANGHEPTGADLARAAKGRAVFIAPDEAEMRHLADAAAFFAPELETLAHSKSWKLTAPLRRVASAARDRR